MLGKSANTAKSLYDMSIHASNCSTLAELVSRNLMLGIRKVNVESC